MFAVHCLDKETAATLRAENRPAHLGYITSSGSIVAAAGPLISAGHAIGGLFILDVADAAAAKDWALNDPFHKLGVYEAVDVHEWKYLIGKGLDPKS